MFLYFLEHLLVCEGLLFIETLVTGEDDSLVEMVQHEVKGCHSVQIPTQNAKQVQLAALDGMEARVGSVESQAFARALLIRIEEAMFETVSHEGVSFAKLIDQRDVVVNFVEFGC